MASTDTLRLKFGTMSGIKTWSFKYASSAATRQEIKDLMQAMIDNGSIYKYPPLVAESATIVKVTEVPFNLD